MAVYVKRGVPVTIQWVLDRSWANPDTGCWEWQLCRNPREGADYGQASLCGRVGGAHRFAWEIANDQLIPEDREIHHTCYVCYCVNPAHLQLVTRSQNTSARRPYRKWLNGMCLNGLHEMTEDNIKQGPNGKRECKACVSLQNARYYRRKKGDGTWKPVDHRPRKGLGRGAPKLTDQQVTEIRRRRAAGERNRDLAREYGVAETTVSAIYHNRTRVAPAPITTQGPISVEELRLILGRGPQVWPTAAVQSALARAASRSARAGSSAAGATGSAT